MENPFLNWKCRASQIGKIMTNLPNPDDAKKIEKRIEELVNERDYGVNANNNKVKWTETKDNELTKLIAKRDNPDELPTGAKTWLDEEYLRVKYNRKKELKSKYLDKGNIVETDSLTLLEFLDKKTYFKNEVHISNDFSQGTPDNIQVKLKDTKSSWDLFTFNNAELTSLYEWQLKDYLWMLQNQENEELETTTEAELCYCLVNAPLSLIQAARKSLYFSRGYSEAELGEDDPEFIDELIQLELNMIFDFNEFQAKYPGYQFATPPELRISIPAHKRVKRFVTELLPEDITNMTKRVLMAREYLINKHEEAEEKGQL